MTVEAPVAPAVPPGSVTPPPAVPPTPPPDLAASLAEVTRKQEELSTRLEEKDRYITELQQNQAALEARLAHTTPPVNGDPSELQTILETGQTDPAEAARKLDEHIQRRITKATETIAQNQQPTAENLAYVAKVKEANPDLIELGLEPVLAGMVTEAMARAKPTNAADHVRLFKASVDNAVKTMRAKVDKLKGSPAPVTPPGANLEGGPNPAPPPTPAPAAPETQEDEVTRRAKARAARGL